MVLYVFAEWAVGDTACIRRQYNQSTMSSTAKYSKKSEETNFQAAEEHHGVGKKQKTRNERKGDGLIKGWYMVRSL